VSVLLVEDDSNLRRALQICLVHNGFIVETAGNGFEALARLSVTKVDVVVTDMNMPRMNGLELIHCLRAHFPAMRTIAISGATITSASRDTLDELGVERLFPKPFDRNELLRALRTPPDLFADDLE